MNEIIAMNKNAGTVNVKPGKNPRQLYEHQVNAITALNKIDAQDSFSTLVVLPTGGGKTMTAATWLLSSAVDKTKKVLWIAHRHLLLEQAAEAFFRNAYTETMVNSTSFKYRIISGQHDRPIHIKTDENVLIVSKDSIIRNLNSLDQWLNNEKELYLIIDEAHHATAKSYRKIIDHVKSKNLKLKILGLTATPFRTSEQEKGLLGKIFTDDILYKIDLDTLIKKGILSTPICESCDTDVILGDNLGLNAIKSIEQLDVIPEDIAEAIADNKERNRFIVKTFFEHDNYRKYGQTLVFALNRTHAFTLKALFEQYGKNYGIKAGVIVSGTSKEFIGVDISNEENQRQIESFRQGEIQVLITVNILTEGVDLPKTQTVFLTRPTISTVLMTQMIGRALRGEKAGGTKDAYIVSFVDNWNSKIAWVNPESVLSNEGNGFVSKDYEHKKRIVRLISIDKIEEFTRIVNETVDTTRLESLDFIKRVPLGMYVFTFIDENNIEHNHQILVYDSTKDQYEELIAALPSLFKEYGIEDEVIEAKMLSELTALCETTYFDEDMIPPYNKRDIEYLFKYFAQKESAPLFIPFEEIDRKKVDLSIIASEIVAKDMRRSEQNNYINSLWEDESNLVRVYFGNKYFFKRQLEIEIDKALGEFEFATEEENVIGEERDITALSLQEICSQFPAYGNELKATVYQKAKTDSGQYKCSDCGKTSPHKALFQVDHIVPMSKGGLTKSENLQLLCRTCNLKKSDKS
ncbi:DEAD/DEAH box helicase family protein [Desulfosporosinus sp. SYSU MS00001]|uniref:DEAD/DEAH box helicase family protein n=1 Tax=Desulfosporosinus sp. SYSU MS00001 TaxID=3416284 RepID=UPI003CEFCAEA